MVVSVPAMRISHAGALAPILLATTLAGAETRHVAITGSDTAAGTAEAPWRTIQRAADAVVPGDTVVIHAGTYTGFRVTADGTEAAPIAFTGEGTVKIDGAATTNRDAVLVEGGAWIQIEGLTVTGATRAGISALDCHHITVRGNRVDANGRWGVFSSHCDDFVVERNEVSRSGTEHGVYASNSADRPVIRDNRIWGNGMCGVHMNGDINFGGDGVISNAIVEGNVILDNGRRGGSAINADGVADSLIRNNVLDGNHASGISLYRIDGGAASTGNRIINNTVRMASDARWAVNIQDGSSGNVMRNNILIHPSASRGVLDICAACTTGMSSDRNAFTGGFMVAGTTINLAAWRTRTGGDGASFTATDAALFTAPATGDLTLRPGSPAIDQGSADGAPAVDVLGTLRPQGAAIDIGAYEHCSGACTGGDDPGGDDPPPPGEDPAAGEPDETGTDDSGDPFVGPAADPDTAGCSAAGSGAGLVLALLPALTLLVPRRRRRYS
ncbi:MAG: hypothetical protein JWP01_1807 [Myxococcales bacterium]|nr:hypothetical protein [Myxococcales bacterium]